MPPVSQVHIDAPLTNLSLAYRNTEFVADQVLPTVPVVKQSDKYYIYDAAKEGLRADDDRRPIGATAKAVDYQLSTDNYYCDSHALKHAIPDELRQNADPGIDLDANAVNFLMDKILLGKEIDLVTKIVAGVSGTTLSGTTQWSHASGVPYDNVQTAQESIIKAVGKVANTLVLPYPVFQKVRKHSTVTGWLKENRSSVQFPSAEQLAMFFGVERVLVPTALKNTAKRGATASVDFVWGKYALLAYVAPGANLMTMSLGLNFRWTLAPGTMSGASVRKFRDPDETAKTDVVAVERYEDQKITVAGAGYLWTDAVA